jgi:hypothetical protein
LESIVEEFIKQAASKLGIDESTSRSATGGILNLIKDKLGASDFSELLNQVPGAEAAVSQAEASAPQASGGGLGGLLGKAASMLGGEGAGNIASALGNSGLSLDKAGPFVSMFINYLKEKLGDDLFDKLKGALPDLTPGD